MTENQEDNAALEGVQGSLFSVGNMLREERMRHGLSVDEVYNRIKFAPRQIEALEADNYAELPESAFVRGFVRSYARLLQIDPEPLLAALPHAPEKPVQLETPTLGEVPFPDANVERRQNIIWLAAALGVAVLLALVAWLVGGKSGEEGAPQSEQVQQKSTVEDLPLPDAVPVSAVHEMEPAAPATATKPQAAPVAKPAVPAPVAPPAKPATPPAPASVAPPVVKPAVTPPAPVAPSAAKPVAPAAPAVTPAKPAATTPAPAPVALAAAKPAAAPAQGAIRLSFSGESWVQVRDKDGKVLLSMIGKPGMEQAVNGSPPFAVDIGYSSGVKLFYKGKPVDLSPYARLEVSHLTLE